MYTHSEIERTAPMTPKEKLSTTHRINRAIGVALSRLACQLSFTMPFAQRCVWIFVFFQSVDCLGFSAKWKAMARRVAGSQTLNGLDHVNVFAPELAKRSHVSFLRSGHARPCVVLGLSLARDTQTPRI